MLHIMIQGVSQSSERILVALGKKNLEKGQIREQE